ncbi:hypothetical protein GS441_19550 [Rhodococcus hoagii]|uniref:Uncharacterized protein n=1 Tax=Rhodococcus hoagii TaxID=43767 RepID=A0A9Q2PDI4_RHOHA|nr:hypothetical protein [Prescottella equi]
MVADLTVPVRLTVLRCKTSVGALRGDPATVLEAWSFGNVPALIIASSRSYSSDISFVDDPLVNR